MKELKCDFCGADLNKKVKVETTLGTVKRPNLGIVVHNKDGNITKAVCKDCYEKRTKERDMGGYRKLD